MAAQVRFLHVGADERSLLLLYDFQGALQHAGRVHHGDAGAVIVRDHVGHLAQQEHRQAALAQNRGDLHLRVNAVAHVDAMVVVVVNAAGRGIHADVIAVFLNGIQQVLQVHAAPAEGDDAGTTDTLRTR